jgi:hypothetical protein
MLETTRKLRPIVAADLKPPAAVLGQRAELCLLPLDRLVVDDRYQRQIGRNGRASVLRILAGFDWRKFTPVVVTPLGDGTFAIIDGQHRATAALMHPDVDMVPCMVVTVSPDEAAACFAAINGQVTAVTPGQIYAARLTAGEADALALQAALAAAGVTVLRYRFPGAPWKVGETLALATLEAALKRCGRDALIAGLQCVTQSGNGNPGCLTSGVIVALVETMAANPLWRNAGARLLEAMDEIDLTTIESECALAARKAGKPRGPLLRARLHAHLAAALGAGVAAKETPKPETPVLQPRVLEPVS